MSPATAAPGAKTWTLNNFAAGEDLRPIGFTADQDRVALLLNTCVTNNKRLRRRPPLRQVSGEFSDNTWGMVQVNGVKYTIAALGATITMPSDVQALRFDIPTGATDHDLEDIESMGDTVCALMRHTFAGGVQRYFLHIFDQKPDLPTYVTDPSFPWMHTIGNLPAVHMTVCANKLLMSGPGGDTFYSGVSDPRKWNQSLVDDFLNDGFELHFYAAATGSQDFVIPVKFEELVDFLFYAGWSFEKFIGTDGIFQDTANWGYNGVPGAAVSGVTSMATTPNLAQATTYTNWSRITYNVPVAGTWYRFRWFPPRPIAPKTRSAVLTGCTPVLSYGTRTTTITITDDTTTLFPLDTDKFYYVGYPSTMGDHYKLTINGTAQVYGASGPGMFDVQSGTDLQLFLRLTNYSPVIGDVLVFSFLIGSDFVPNPEATANNAWLHVPAGTLRTPAGDIAWPGAGALFFTGAANQIACIKLKDDYTVDPAAMMEVIGADAGMTPTTVLDGVKRLHRIPIAWISNSAGLVSLNTDSIDSFKVRNSAWDETAYAKAQALAGAAVDSADAGFLPTSAHDASGGQVTLLAHVKSRLLVGYKGGCQLWNLDENGNNDALLDTSPIGTSDQTVPQAVLFQGVLMTTLAGGFWALSLTNYLSDTIRSQQMGDLIEPAGLPQVQACAYWPDMGQFVAFADTGDEGVYFRVFDFSTKSKIAAWERWTVAGISSVDYKTMIPVGSRLYFRSGTGLFYFDASVYTAASPSFRDDTDPPGAGNAYLSTVRWWWNNFQKPGSSKKFVFYDISQRGQSTASFYTIPGDLEHVIEGPTVDGSTYNRLRVGLSMRSEAIALQLDSTDERGWELEQIGVDFMYGKR